MSTKKSCLSRFRANTKLSGHSYSSLAGVERFVHFCHDDGTTMTGEEVMKYFDENVDKWLAAGWIREVTHEQNDSGINRKVIWFDETKSYRSGKMRFSYNDHAFSCVTVVS